MERHLSLRLAAGALALSACLGPAPAFAAAVSFVSAKGLDSGTCASPTSPCRTFTYAYGQTSAGGDILAVDPGDYGPLVIQKSISITGVTGAGVINAAGGAHITINAGATDTVNLTGLTLNGAGVTNVGVQLNSGGVLAVRNCVISHYANIGLEIRPTVETKLLVENTSVASAFDAVILAPVVVEGSGLKGAFRRVSLSGGGGSGMVLDQNPAISVVNSLITDFGIAGVFYFGGNTAPMHFRRSTITRNSTGLVLGAPGASAGDNLIRDNATNVSGALNNVGMQ